MGCSETPRGSCIKILKDLRRSYDILLEVPGMKTLQRFWKQMLSSMFGSLAPSASSDGRRRHSGSSISHYSYQTECYQTCYQTYPFHNNIFYVYICENLAIKLVPLSNLHLSNCPFSSSLFPYILYLFLSNFIPSNYCLWK